MPDTAASSTRKMFLTCTGDVPYRVHADETRTPVRCRPVERIENHFGPLQQPDIPTHGFDNCAQRCPLMRKWIRALKRAVVREKHTL
jgi:hypothetical protein